MGAWGSGPFDNDAALDWVTELEGRGHDAVRDALDTGNLDDADDASVAVAAAALVAGVRPSGDDLPPEAMTWLDGTAPDALDPFVPRALAVLDRVARSGELRDLWEDAGELDEWSEGIGLIRHQLVERTSRAD